MMKFSFSKLKKAVGKTENNEKKQLEEFTNDLIKSIEYKPFAISNENICYASTNELAGYYFLQTFVIGKFKIKTFEGAQLQVLGNELELTLDSDMKELESEPYKVPKSYVTRIDFMLNEEDLSKMSRSNINALLLSAKKERVEFSIIKLNEEEE